jgi:BMFP domain-containing protein YqiC
MIASADELVENDPVSRPRAAEHDRFWPKSSWGTWSHKLLAAGMLHATSAQSLEWVMSQNRVFDDFARLVTDASEMAQGVRREAETVMKGQLERLLAAMDVVTREEFEAVKQMAVKARDGNKKLSQRVAALEAEIKAESKDSGG